MEEASTTTTTTAKKTVIFATPESESFWFDGVTEEERDDVWFRRTDYVEFVEAELRRRELLTEIEEGNNKKHARRSSDTSKGESEMKHTFTRRMVSRTFSAGPTVRRRRRLPRRERNELDISNHSSSHVKKRQLARTPRNAASDDTNEQEPVNATTVKAMAASVGKIRSSISGDAVPVAEKEQLESAAAKPTQSTAASNSPVAAILDRDLTPPPLEIIEPAPAIGTTSPPKALTV
ncbi:expressed unknown protein [Seminavis robusta]|uniref:Uncharacterized protein n=1 Tax=Seminavis robusta TaxID=568900 RepID=A0A9N8ERQ4_9STRA|nr:expressed unknown protein [Seminavis robusta]|eukprot:Sro1516_g279120.1 n/a (235) ;mRNA; f:17668-18372